MFVAACATGPSDDGAGGGPSGQPGPQVIKPDAQDVSPPLTELAKMTVPDAAGLPHEAEPVRPIPHMRTRSAGQVVDPVVQSATGGSLIAAPLTTFEGMGGGLQNFRVNVAPPDTDGDIGPNHYVQIVNSSVTIFNRSGNIVMGPVLTRTFWNGFSGACANTNDGDGVVRYDRYADRWVISQFSNNGGNGPFFQCIAVSTTGNPTGTYNRYQFSFESLNDYPKIGLWPDGYYFTYNLFSPTAFVGARVCAADRAKMIAGAAATQVCFTTSNQFGGLLATDLDGPALPPAGTPESVLALDTTALDSWRFHVDFATPSHSTFTGPTPIPVDPFSPLCNGGTCVVQPSTTNRLDSLADRLMNRAVYRQFSDHNAVVVTHAVAAGTGGGVRWYELRNTDAATPTMFQQGTYAPNANNGEFRWMSSAAFDGAGNIGLGFSISSSATRPSIGYTGRLVTDDLGTMGQGEGTIIGGHGSQINNLTRWGDYSSMNIDPVDDCTFWYTSEYLSMSGSFNWRTRIGSFKLANCGTPTNDFSISVSPASQTANAGASVSYTVTTAVTAGSAQTINLSVSGLPSGVTASFSPASVTAGHSSTLTLTAASSAPSSTAMFTVTGTSTSATHTASASLTVVGNDFSISVSPASQTVNAGASVSYTVTTAVTTGSAQTINLSVSGLPSGVTASFSPASVTAGGSSTLTLTAASSAPSSTAAFTVTGTGTSATHTASASLTVVTNDFSISVSPASQTVNAGTSISYTVTTAVTTGSVQTINLSVSGLPSGVTASFSPASVTAGGSSTLTLTAASSAPSSTAAFTVTGTGTSATHTASASLTVVAANNGCINAMFTSTDVPKSIPDNDTTGVTSTLAVTGNGNVGSLVLSLSITHSFIGDLVVTLIAPDNTQFVVSNRQGASGANLVINNLAISAFGGHVAAGTWRLKVQDLAQLDVGTIDSWSLTIAGTCSPVVNWSGSATPNIATVDASTVCTSLTVPTSTGTGTDSVLAKLNISGSHSFCAILSGTLSHNGNTVTAFPIETFPAGPCNFNLTSSPVPGLSGDARGTWTLCITDNDAFGDTGVLNSWSVHN